MEENPIEVEKAKIRILDKLLTDIGLVLLENDSKKRNEIEGGIIRLISSIKSYLKIYKNDAPISNLLQKQKSYLITIINAIERRDVDSIKFNARIFRNAGNDLIAIYSKKSGKV